MTTTYHVPDLTGRTIQKQVLIEEVPVLEDGVGDRLVEVGDEEVPKAAGEGLGKGDGGGLGEGDIAVDVTGVGLEDASGWHCQYLHLGQCDTSLNDDCVAKCSNNVLSYVVVCVFALCQKVLDVAGTHMHYTRLCDIA